jgi:hypothetical protein
MGKSSLCRKFKRAFQNWRVIFLTGMIYANELVRVLGIKKPALGWQMSVKLRRILKVQYGEISYFNPH